ncbi:hypothetical protein PMIT1306_00256 [Prochlorococcus sp. MIT 1306]|nr:hypothetical protein PMIT1306_00256 [Prochlorococcus sp. MIT 1306]
MNALSYSSDIGFEIGCYFIFTGISYREQLIGVIVPGYSINSLTVVVVGGEAQTWQMLKIAKLVIVNIVEHLHHLAPKVVASQSVAD